jgi:hypothetical protein
MMDLSPMMSHFRVRFAPTKRRNAMFTHGPSCLEGPVSRTLCRWAGKATESSPGSSEIRTELVERVRREIAEGRYETDEKWDAALEVLFRRWHEA